MLFSNPWHLFLCILITSFFMSCATGSDPFPIGKWEQAELDNVGINSLNKFNGVAYAATDSGLYRTEINHTSWASIGLQEEKVLGVVFLPDNKLLANIRISDFSEGIPSLYLSSDQGQSWKSYINDYGGETEVTWVEAIAAVSKPSDTLYARGSGLMVARSVNGGRNWELIHGRFWDLWGGRAALMKVDPFHEGRIFAGGTDPFSQPYLLKSPDYGETWYALGVGTTATTCHAVATHPRRKDFILAASDALQKSTDGGKTWKTVFNQASIYTLAHSAQNPKTVYASGVNSSGTIFFAKSTNFGDSWQMIEMENSPTDIQVNDMVSVMVEGKEVLYLGTNKGVYSYTFEN